ncbi:MAG: ribosome maturation factor RimM [Steroidobacteraceae bacterium]
MSGQRTGHDRRAVQLGRIGAPFGVQGWVKVTSYTEPPEGIAGYRSWNVVRAGVAHRRVVLDWKRAGRAVAVRLEGIDSRDQAAALTGSEVEVDRDELPPAGPGEVYWHDLIGLEAANREGAPLGRVDSVMELPAHPVLVLSGERERLVPLVRERLVAVDLAAGRVTLDWHPDD